MLGSLYTFYFIYKVFTALIFILFYAMQHKDEMLVRRMANKRKWKISEGQNIKNKGYDQARSEKA